MVLASLLLFYLLLAAENLVTHSSVPALAWAGRFGRLLLGQFENLAFAGIAVAPLAWIYPYRLLRLIYAALLSLVLVYMVIDQVFYGLFFAHFQFGLVEGQEISASIFKDSILFELGRGFLFNAGVAAALSILLARRLAAPQSDAPWPGWSRSRTVALGAGAGIGASLLWFGTVNAKPDNLNSHPVVSMIRSAFKHADRASVVEEQVSDFYKLRHGEPTNSAVVPPVVGPSAPPPNIVLVILESVGSEQLLPNGGLDPALTPNLARLAPEMTIFPTVYDTFPGTVRSHVPLSTGGRTITWGSVYDEFSFPYAGPTIVGELKRSGLAAGLFSAALMDTENLGGFYEQLPYDVRDYPDAWPGAERKRFSVDSWGVDERETARRAAAWVGETDGPVFVHLLTSSTHHPYSVPADFPRPPGDGDRRACHRNALHFLDSVIGDLHDRLERLRPSERTVWFILGDHGEAFGDKHPTNLIHKNHLYEENIRNFLLVVDPQRRDGPLSVPRIASLGDVAPSLVAFVSRERPDFAGQNLFSPDYRERVVYFHKNALPEKWGLRDGRFKFIIEQIGRRNPELYDLETDSDEQTNLAEAHPEQVREYVRMAASWYIAANADYVRRLPGFSKPGGVTLKAGEVQSLGPKRLVFGTRDAKGKFFELKRIHPEEEMIAWTLGVPFRTDQSVDYEWQAPDGNVRRFSFVFEKDWSTVEVFHSSVAPMAEGRWQVRLSADGKELIRGEFDVRRDAELHVRRSFHPKRLTRTAS